MNGVVERKSDREQPPEISRTFTAHIDPVNILLTRAPRRCIETGGSNVGSVTSNSMFWTAHSLTCSREYQNQYFQAIGRIERQLELEARLLGEMDDSAKIAIGVQVAPPIPDVSHPTPEQFFAQQR
jgi:hypothetical protein